MLVLSRKVDERIRIGDVGVITVVRIGDDSVRLGFEFPADVAIVREEIDRRAPVPNFPPDLLGWNHAPSARVTCD